MKVLTLIVSSFILLSRSDANMRQPPLCGCAPDLTKICASNGKTYNSVCAMKCDYNYVGLYKVAYGACEDNDPIPIPYPPPYQPDPYRPSQYYPYPYYPVPYTPPPPQPRYIYYPPPQNIPSGPIGSSRPLIGSAAPHHAL